MGQGTGSGWGLGRVSGCGRVQVVGVAGVQGKWVWQGCREGGWMVGLYSVAKDQLQTYLYMYMTSNPKS